MDFIGFFNGQLNDFLASGLDKEKSNDFLNEGLLSITEYVKEINKNDNKDDLDNDLKLAVINDKQNEEIKEEKSQELVLDLFKLLQCENPDKDKIKGILTKLPPKELKTIQSTLEQKLSNGGNKNNEEQQEKNISMDIDQQRKAEDEMLETAGKKIQQTIERYFSFISKIAKNLTGGASKPWIKKESFNLYFHSSNQDQPFSIQKETEEKANYYKPEYINKKNPQEPIKIQKIFQSRMEEYDDLRWNRILKDEELIIKNIEAGSEETKKQISRYDYQFFIYKEESKKILVTRDTINNTISIFDRKNEINMDKLFQNLNKELFYDISLKEQQPNLLSPKKNVICR